MFVTVRSCLSMCIRFLIHFILADRCRKITTTQTDTIAKMTSFQGKNQQTSSWIWKMSFSYSVCFIAQQKIKIMFSLFSSMKVWICHIYSWSINFTLKMNEHFAQKDQRTRIFRTIFRFQKIQWRIFFDDNEDIVFIHSISVAVSLMWYLKFKIKILFNNIVILSIRKSSWGVILLKFKILISHNCNHNNRG